jgi:glutamate 5-kinase
MQGLCHLFLPNPSILSVYIAGMEALKQSNTVVIKVGSALIAKPDTGRANLYWLAGLARDIAELRRQGKQVCIVSSGAVTLGRALLGMPRGVLAQEEKQAAAACGQMVMMQAWRDVFSEDEIRVAQVLLTIDDSESRRRYLNARNTLHTLLHHGIIPIINENDTVATSELRVGDNDRLAARAAQMVGADMLFLLSDIDGLYSADPTKYPQAVFIPEVREVTDVVRSYAAPPTTMVGTGGMITKVEAAVIATSSGCHTVIARGTTHRPVTALMEGARHTIFLAHTTPMGARKEWIAGALAPSGILTIDDGAVAALHGGKSLLPVGIVAVSGQFQRGDAVLVQPKAGGGAIAKGLACYTSAELRQIMGKQSQQIPSVLGYDRGNVVIHRDDMVMV